MSTGRPPPPELLEEGRLDEYYDWIVGDDPYDTKWILKEKAEANDRENLKQKPTRYVDTTGKARRL